MKTPKVNPYFALIVGVIAVSTSAILVKLSSADSGVIAFYRLFFTVVMMLPFFLVKNVREVRAITLGDWVKSIIAGIFLAFHFILWFESLNLTSVASSTVLVTLQPLFAFIGAFLIFKESFSAKAILSGVIAVIGSFIISWGDFAINGKALLGDFIALAACALVTGYLLIGQNIRKRLSLMTYTFIVYAISSIVLFLYILMKKEPFYHLHTQDWIYFILLAIFPTLLGHTIFNWCIKWISTATISMAILFEPIGAAILAYYIFNEKIVITQVIGGIIIIVSVVFFVLDGKSPKRKVNH
ncbi:DMT family transporter [Heyndrickxia camelliae]|uniref:EamA family transporter n=1 Tax=Heyndrickxia camelliae TaxID=1707093 RepID=A0A2N3LGU7_9BACI|nr:EamA family transporter [Heyndrickxia camelliae]PKR83841.1 EamA family transporter [Heyndrickxia camelliae]